MTTDIDTHPDASGPRAGDGPGDAVEAAVSRLTVAAATRTPCAPVRDLLGDTGIDAAYEVQRRLAAARTAAGARRVGAKIGLTAPAVQEQFGVFEPDFGMLFDDMVFAHGEPVALDRFVQPRAEERSPSSSAATWTCRVPLSRTSCGPPPSSCRPSRSWTPASAGGT